MELKATTLGKRLAQHPYDRAVILNAGIKGPPAIATNTLFLSINYWRFTVSAVWYGANWSLYCRDGKVVRLHGTEWGVDAAFLPSS